MPSNELPSILTALSGVLLLISGCLWAVLLAGRGTSALLWVGLGCTVLALALLVVSVITHRRGVKTLERVRQEESDALEREYTNLLSQAYAENQAKMEHFRSSLSHTLRMPVSIIQGYADLLSSGMVKDPAVALEYLGKIRQRSQYMTEAISRQFSEDDTMDSTKLAYSNFDLMALLRQAAADMHTAAKEHGISIQVISPEETVSIRADAYLLNRVFYNLLENALKYMGRPGVITIRVVLQGSNVSVLVQDDGLGLPSAETKHIFDSNYQGSNHSHGQGYGLYLVRRAVEAHGGTVSAQSAPGQGMGITILLPLNTPA